MAAPSKRGWEAAILRDPRINAPVTKENLRYLHAWLRGEGGTATNNPFNTTQSAPGATPYNSNGGYPVLNYPTPDAGIEATVKTLANGRYGGILAGLRKGDNAQSTAAALSASPWGTGALVQKVLGGSVSAAPVVGPAGPGAGSAAPQGADAQPSVPSPMDAMRSSLLQGLLGSLGDFAAGGKSQSQSPLAALIAAAQTPAQQAPPPPAPLLASPKGLTRSTQSASPAASGAIPGVAEAFYDPLGSYDNGAFGGPIGGHSDHVHISDTDPQGMIQAIKLAQSMGLRVGENPYVGNPADPGVHVKDSYHYRNFPGLFGGKQLGEAIDASGSADIMAAFYKAMTNQFRGRGST